MRQCQLSPAYNFKIRYYYLISFNILTKKRVESTDCWCKNHATIAKHRTYCQRQRGFLVDSHNRTVASCYRRACEKLSRVDSSCHGVWRIRPTTYIILLFGRTLQAYTQPSITIPQ